MKTVKLVALFVVALAVGGCCRGSSTSSKGSTGTGSGIGSPAAGSFGAGENVDVEWNGSWWQGRILSVNGGLYRVHYVGWASSWDESVPARRVRGSTGSAKRGSGPS